MYSKKLAKKFAIRCANFPVMHSWPGLFAKMVISPAPPVKGPVRRNILRGYAPLLPRHFPGVGARVHYTECIL